MKLPLPILLLPLLACCAFAQTPISSCGTYGPGTYVLSNDIDVGGVPPPAPCLTFSAGGSVQLDGQGHTVTGGGVGQAAVIVSGASGNSYLRNFTIAPASPCSRTLDGGHLYSCHALSVTYSANGVNGNQMTINAVSIADSFGSFNGAMSLSGDNIYLANSALTLAGLALNGSNFQFSGDTIQGFLTSFNDSPNVVLDLQEVTNSNFSGLTIAGTTIGHGNPIAGIRLYGTGSGNTLTNIAITGVSQCGFLFADDTSSAGSIGSRYLNNTIAGAASGFCYNDPGNPGSSIFDGNTFQGNVTANVQYGFLMVGPSQYTNNIDSNNTWNGSTAPVKNELYATVPSGGAGNNFYTQDIFQLNGQPGTPDFCGGLSDCGIPAAAYVMDGGGNNGQPATQTNYPLVLTNGTTGNAPSITYPPAMNSAVSGAAMQTMQFAAAGGSGSYTWSASGLPSGVSMSSSGLLSGTTVSTGAFTPTVTVTDANTSAAASQQFSQTVTVTHFIASPSLPSGQVGVAYSGSVTADTTASWCFTPGRVSGLIPSGSGTTLSISGTPTTAGTFNLLVIAGFSGSCSGANIFGRVFTLTIVPAASQPLSVTDCSSTINQAGGFYTMSANVGSTSNPCTFFVSPPAGRQTTLDCQSHTIYGTFQIRGGSGFQIQNCSIVPPPQYQGLGGPPGFSVFAFLSFPGIPVTMSNVQIASGNEPLDYASITKVEGPFSITNSVFHGTVFLNASGQFVNNTVLASHAWNDTQGADLNITQLGFYPAPGTGNNTLIVGNTVIGQCNNGGGLNQATCPPPASGFEDSNIVVNGTSGLDTVTVANNYLQHTANANIELAQGSLSNLSVVNNIMVADANVVVGSGSTLSGIATTYNAALSSATISGNYASGPYAHAPLGLVSQSSGGAATNVGNGMLTNVTVSGNTFDGAPGVVDGSATCQHFVNTSGFTSIAALLGATQGIFQCSGTSCSYDTSDDVCGVNGTTCQIHPWGSGVVFTDNVFSVSGAPIGQIASGGQTGTCTTASNVFDNCGNFTNSFAATDLSGVLTGTGNACSYPSPANPNAICGFLYPNPFSCNPSSSLAISTASLPAGSHGASYAPVTLAATSGVAPLYWYGLGLPTGMTVGFTSGILSGTPTAAGTYSVTLVVEDTSSAQARVTLPLVVN